MYNGDAHTLKLLVNHGMKRIPTHAKIAEKTLARMECRYNSLEYYLTRQDTVCRVGNNQADLQVRRRLSKIIQVKQAKPGEE
jgi:hypothetical protein